MKSLELERTAYSVECFLNALRMNDGKARTMIEEWLVRWLAGETRCKGDHAIYSRPNIYCYSAGKIVKSFSLPDVTQDKSIWCNGNKLSVIDTEAYAKSGKLLMLGTAGLVLTLPGAAAAAAAKGKAQRSSNNNNNNNNNNG